LNFTTIFIIIITNNNSYKNIRNYNNIIVEIINKEISEIKLIFV